ncbi:MAG: hypothetical protein RL385_5721 [Pseudomonadota bacterium]|jgi:hypothetical protein
MQGPAEARALGMGAVQRKDLLRALALYVATRLALAVFVWLTGQHFECHGKRCTYETIVAGNYLLNGLFQWDAGNYVRIIRDGYYIRDGFDTTATFFPAFPVAAWLLGKVVGSPLVAGIALNHVASIVGAYAMCQLVRELGVGASDAPTREATARETTLFWLAAPLAFFHSVFLTESLFAASSAVMLLSVVRGRWLGVLLAGIVVTATRSAGMVVVASAALLAWERRKQERIHLGAALCIALSPLGLAAFMAWQHKHLGDAMAWSHVQIRWNRFLTTPWHTIADGWLGLPTLDGNRNVDRMYAVQELMALALPAPLFLLRKRFHLPWALWFLGFCEWLLPLLSHGLPSAARFQSGNLYFALAIPALLSQYPTLRGLCWMLFGMVMAWYASTFPFGNWAS